MHYFDKSIARCDYLNTVIIYTRLMQIYAYHVCSDDNIHCKNYIITTLNNQTILYHNIFGKTNDLIPSMSLLEDVHIKVDH